MITRSLSSDQIGPGRPLPRTSSTAVSDVESCEISSLKSLIRERNVAALAQFQATDLKAVARLCLAMADTYPEEVTVVLWNSVVALQAAQLLRAMARLRDVPSVARRALALARAMLGAGHHLGQPVDWTKAVWPGAVNAMLEERYAADGRYWVAKIQKFDEKPYKHGVKTFNECGKPFFSFSDCKLAENLNGRLFDEAGNKFTCRHWVRALASQHDQKHFLRSVRLKDPKVLGLDYAVLEQRDSEAMQVAGRSSVQFSLQHFGKLLVRMVPLVPKGEVRGFLVSFAVSRQLGSGHEMMVFLKKAASSRSTEPAGRDPMELKVSFYDPNVTGDMVHTRVLPEDLVKLKFQDFVSQAYCDRQGLDVLSMDLGDPALARALAGQFIAREQEALISSFLCALAYGSLHEMREATSALLRLGAPAFEVVNGVRSGELAQALYYALWDNHADVVRELVRSPLVAALRPAAVKKMVLAIDHMRVPGLYNALWKDHRAVIEAFGELLAKLETQLSDEDLAQVLWAARVKGPQVSGVAEALRLGHEGAVAAYGTGVLEPLMHRLKPWMLEKLLAPEQLGHLPGWVGALLLDCEKAPEAWRRALETLTRHRQLGLLFVRERLWEQTEQGVPRLHRALEKNRGDIVHALSQVVRESRLPSHELGRLLDPGPQGAVIRKAIELERWGGLQAYLEMVVAIQSSDFRLNHGDAWLLRHKIRHAHGKRLPFYLACLWADSTEYKHMRRSNKALGALFVKVEHLLQTT